MSTDPGHLARLLGEFAARPLLEVRLESAAGVKAAAEHTEASSSRLEDVRRLIETLDGNIAAIKVRGAAIEEHLASLTKASRERESDLSALERQVRETDVEAAGRRALAAIAVRDAEAKLGAVKQEFEHSPAAAAARRARQIRAEAAVARAREALAALTRASEVNDRARTHVTAARAALSRLGEAAAVATNCADRARGALTTASAGRDALWRLLGEIEAETDGLRRASSRADDAHDVLAQAAHRSARDIEQAAELLAAIDAGPR